MLFGTTIAHVRIYPLIWWNSIYSVPWFPAPEPNTTTGNLQQSTTLPSTHAKKPSNSTRNSFIVFRYDRDGQLTRPDDVESNVSEPILFPEQSNGLQLPAPPAPPMPRPQSNNLQPSVLPVPPMSRPQSNGSQPSVPPMPRPLSSRPAWAKKTSGRRGLDSPFGTKSEASSSGSGPHAHVAPSTLYYGGANLNLAAPQPQIAQMRRGVDQPFARRVDGPAVPPAVHPHPAAESRDNLQVPHFDVRPLTPVQRKRTVSPVFSEKVHDQDSPIPLPQRSEWIQADSQRSVIPSRTKGR